MNEPYVDNDSYYAAMRAPDRFSYSKPFPLVREFEGGPPLEVGQTGRYAYQVVDPADHVTISRGDGGEIVLRKTATRQQIKAIFLQGDRTIRRLILQRFNASGRALQDSFSLSGHEVDLLRDFLRLIETAPLEDQEGSRLDAATMRKLLSNPEVAQEVYENSRDEIFALIEDDLSARDVLALKRKRLSLNEFECMLDNPDYFTELRAKENGSLRKPEDVWQSFFDSNRWMFGLGLAPQVLLSWEEGALEQTIVGRSITFPGKRVDALLHSAGALSSVCLVEIKRHDTQLMEPDCYRAGAWQAAKELAGGIAQSHANVSGMIREHEGLTHRDRSGFTTGKTAYVCRPRSYLVIGSLTEFTRGQEVNEGRFRSFENLRRSISDPEILTFDELYQRAACVLAGLEEESAQ